jgi:peptidase M50-like protein
MTQQCGDCERASETPLRPVRPVVTRINVCDECFQRRERRGLITILGLVLIPALLTVPSAGPWGVIAALAFLACFPTALVVHELGHALAARAVGYRVRQVDLGIGREMTRFEVGTVPVVIRSLPVAGKVLFGGGPRRGARGRLIIAIAAGPVASAVVAAVGWAVPVPAMSGGLVTAGVLGCVTSLWPRKRIAALGLPTDGYQIITTARSKKALIDANVAVLWATEAAELSAAGKSAEAERRVDEGLDQCPGDQLLSVVRAGILAEVRPAEGLAANRALADPLPNHPHLRTSVLNGIAWCALLMWDQDLLAEADRASAEAFELAPDNAAVWDTRGLALIRTGRIEEGLELSRRALATELPDRHRAHVQCAVALGCALLGDPAAARDHLEAARAVLPADDLLLGRVAEALSATLVPSV